MMVETRREGHFSPTTDHAPRKVARVHPLNLPRPNHDVSRPIDSIHLFAPSLSLCTTHCNFPFPSTSILHLTLHITTTHTHSPLPKPLFQTTSSKCFAPSPPAVPSPASPAWHRRRASPSRPQRLPRRSQVPSRLTVSLARSVRHLLSLSRRTYRHHADFVVLLQSTPTARSAVPRRRSVAHSPLTALLESSVCISFIFFPLFDS